MKWSPWNVAHGTTALLSWHAKKFCSGMIFLNGVALNQFPWSLNYEKKIVPEMGSGLYIEMAPWCCRPWPLLSSQPSLLEAAIQGPDEPHSIWLAPPTTHAVTPPPASTLYVHYPTLPRPRLRDFPAGFRAHKQYHLTSTNHRIGLFPWCPGHHQKVLLHFQISHLPLPGSSWCKETTLPWPNTGCDCG